MSADKAIRSLAVLLAWAIVGVHALRIARANPIRALRYE